MQDAKERPVLLVGSVPLGSSRAVFEAVGTKLGNLIKRIPDGETGARKDWIVWQADVFKNAKGLEPGSTRELQGGYHLTLTSWQCLSVGKAASDGSLLSSLRERRLRPASGSPLHLPAEAGDRVGAGRPSRTKNPLGERGAIHGIAERAPEALYDQRPAVSEIKKPEKPNK